MLRFGHALAVLVLLSCGGKTQSRDDAVAEAPAPETRLAQLAGSWSGSAHLSGYGTVVGSAIVETGGHGRYFLSVSGAQHNGSFQILSWDGNYLVAESQGHSERVHATLSGDALWVDHALIGQVRLDRSPATAKQE